MLCEPSLGLRVRQTQLEDCGRHRQERVKVEGAGTTATDPGCGLSGAILDPVPELTRQDAAALDR